MFSTLCMCQGEADTVTERMTVLPILQLPCFRSLHFFPCCLFNLPAKSKQKQSGRHLDKFLIYYAKFISMHNSSLQYSAHYPSHFSSHPSSASLVPFISSHLPLSFPLCVSLLGSLRLVPVCRGINQTINVTAIYIGNVICKKLISTLHLYICSRPKFVLEATIPLVTIWGFGKRDRDVFI